jgi:hypothetical protein
MPTTTEPAAAAAEVEPDPELRAFLERFDSGEYDGRLFEEIKRLDVDVLEKVGRILATRKFGEN